jgi:hypothetical protein
MLELTGSSCIEVDPILARFWRAKAHGGAQAEALAGRKLK